MHTQIAFSILIVITSVYILIRKLLQKRIEKQAESIFNVNSEEWKPKERESILHELKNTDFDVLIIGGGSSGAGCALDAVTRGLKVAIVELNDFGSGTSTKSTKLLHGGIRYLEKAFNNLDYTQFNLVYEGLHERKTVMDGCPYLSRKLEIMFPVYKKILVPYYYFGLKFYEIFSGLKSLGNSRYIPKNEVINHFKHIRTKNLVGAVTYFDGQFSDGKYNVMLALTAAFHGACVANHIAVKDIIYEEGKVIGARCFDKISKSDLNIKSKVIINTTGQFADDIVHMVEPSTRNMLEQSAGSHFVIPREYCPSDMGFVDPDTSDGRVAFFLPFKDKVIVGSTDTKCDKSELIRPTKRDLDFLLHEVNFYTDNKLNISKNEVLSIWTGVRPLIKDENAEDTENIVRKHLIKINKNRMVTLTGGKWTIFRLMAEQTIDKIVKCYKLNTKYNCLTRKYKLLGSIGYDEKTVDKIMVKLDTTKEHARHLAESYGTRAFILFNYKKEQFNFLLPDYYFTEEEVCYCIDNEMAIRITDVICNRFMLAHIDVRASLQIISKVGNIMKEKLHWNDEHYNEEIENAMEFLRTFGTDLIDVENL